MIGISIYTVLSNLTFYISLHKREILIFINLNETTKEKKDLQESRLESNSNYNQIDTSTTNIPAGKK